MIAGPPVMTKRTTFRFTYTTNWYAAAKTLQLRSDCSVGQLAAIIGFRSENLKIDHILANSSQTLRSIISAQHKDSPHEHHVTGTQSNTCWCSSLSLLR